MQSEREQSLAAQKRLCKEKGWPMFMPFNGICFGCRQDIVPAVGLETMATGHVTGCPLCLYSFCD